MNKSRILYTVQRPLIRQISGRRLLNASFRGYTSAESLETNAKTEVKDKVNIEGESAAEIKETSEGVKEVQSLELESKQKELEAKQKEAADLKDRYLRAVADFRNLQERTKREVQSAREFAIQRFAKDLIESIDNLDRALDTVPQELREDREKNKDLADLYSGLKMTESILMNTLAKHGIERFDASGELFNPNKHEATFEVPQPDKEPGTVFHTQQKGFTLHGRVLRAAKVGVVKKVE